MVINENLIKYIFNKRNIIKHTVTLVMMLAIMTIVLGIITFKVYNTMYDNYVFTIKSTYAPEYYTKEEKILAKCKAINCKDIFIEREDGSTKRLKILIQNRTADKLEVVSDTSLRYSSYTKFFTADYNLIVKVGNEIYTINDNNYILTLINITIVLYVVLCILFTVITLYNMYLSYKNSIYEKTNYKMYSESKIQGNITEMLHHEINAPIAVLRAITDDIVHFTNGAKFSKEETNELIHGMDYSLDRLETILRMLYDNRDVKKQNGDNTIYTLLWHIVNSVNKIHIGKLEPEFHNGDLMGVMCIDPLLGNGNFLNILNVMINNSLEAGASRIDFDVKIHNDKYIWLFIKDNGKGIRDKNNKIFNNAGKVITSYGYSSKDKDGKHINNDSLWSKLLSLFGIRVVTTDTNRGIGLYMNKVLLKKSGGDIKLVETSQNGTTFKILVPVVRADTIEHI